MAVQKLFDGNVQEQAKSFLNNTDWKVLRHADQKALGIATSLTDDEYKELLQKRQSARDTLNS